MPCPNLASDSIVPNQPRTMQSGHIRHYHSESPPQVSVDEGPFRPSHDNPYKAFIGGAVSGAAKLAVGHPFDTVKVRLQVSRKEQFSGPLDCLWKTIRAEGPQALYKGVTPPMIGWMISDSVMLGSLTFYRRTLLEHGFRRSLRTESLSPSQVNERLPTIGHALAGCFAGWTVSVVANPVEQIKNRLQIQYATERSKRFYAGPIDCARKIVGAHGIAGLYHGLAASVAFRSFFFVWWGSYDIFTKFFKRNTTLSAPVSNFWAGGLSAQVFWLSAYPFDSIKQRIMTDPLGGALRDGQPKYNGIRSAARAIYQQAGWKGYWRGFAPCFLRALPANGAALVAFEATIRWTDNTSETGMALA